MWIHSIYIYTRIYINIFYGIQATNTLKCQKRRFKHGRFKKERRQDHPKEEQSQCASIHKNCNISEYLMEKWTNGSIKHIIFVHFRIFNASKTSGNGQFMKLRRKMQQALQFVVSKHGFSP